MRGHAKPAWTISPADRARLQALLDAVPEEAAENSPEFLGLLNFWQEVKPPYGVRPLVHAYRCYGGEWVTGGVSLVLAEIRVHLRAGMTTAEIKEELSR